MKKLISRYLIITCCAITVAGLLSASNGYGFGSHAYGTIPDYSTPDTKPDTKPDNKPYTTPDTKSPVKPNPLVIR